MKYVNDTIDANITHDEDKTPLIVAVENGHIGVRMLIGSGKADLHRRDYMGRSALVYCYWLRYHSSVHAELTKLFLDTNGVDLKLTDSKWATGNSHLLWLGGHTQASHSIRRC